MADSALKRLANLGSSNGDWVIAALEGVQASEGQRRTDPGWFHPSDLSNECDAFLAFAYLGAPGMEKIPARTQRIFDHGNGRDRQLKQNTKDARISLIIKPEDRKIVIPPYRIRGELDEWVENPISKTRYVIDFKTMRSDYFKALKDATESHKTQLHPYMFAKETYQGYVLYENKDTQEQQIFDVKFDWERWKKITDRTEKVRAELDKSYVARNPVGCSSCPFGINGVCTSNQIDKLKEASKLWSH